MMRLLGNLLLITGLAVLPGCQHSEMVAKTETRPAFEQILKIDVHAHIFEDMPELVEMLCRNRVRLINVCNRGRDGHLEEMHRIAKEMAVAHPEAYSFASNFDLTRIEQPGYASEVVGWLDQSYRNGAVMTKIWKEVGLEVRRSDGSFILPDDPLFDPIYAYMAKQRKPLHAHLAEPIDAWLPLDRESAHYGYYSNNPQWHLFGKEGYPSHAALIAARDHILQKHPKLTMIAAHFASLEHDLDQLAERLDRYPNLNVDSAGRTRNLIRHPPEKVRKFFTQYQDRILYGVDMTWKPFLQGPRIAAQRAAFVRQLENRYKADFEFYSGAGPMRFEGRDVEGLNLPRKILEKFYHGNAERLILKHVIN